MRGSFFKIHVSNGDTFVFINSFIQWEDEDDKPRLKDYIAIKHTTGFTVYIQPMSHVKLGFFANCFGLKDVDFIKDLKGQKSLDQVELSLDRNFHHYFRPSTRGPSRIHEIQYYLPNQRGNKEEEDNSCKQQPQQSQGIPQSQQCKINV